ncbi:RRP15-like protein [Apostichopus japonicus]|uniref:RRP15-like protein n=1 Tax=Stichopus japonicus TaxID=307972 RepID=UPI003AB4D61D
MSDQFVSFLKKEAVDSGNRRKYKKSFVSVDYSSGSDGDVESDPETAVSPSKKLKRSNKVLKRYSTSHKARQEKDGGDDEDDDEGTLEKNSVSSVDDGNQRPIPGAGWADVMSKILGRPAATTTTVVLSKSKAYSKAKHVEKEELTERQKLEVIKKQKENLGREKPQPLKKDVERRLQRIAVRGVVQFFNAVGKQQKLREDKLKEATTENKRIKAESSLSKGDFLDMLKTSNNKSSKTGQKVMEEEENKPAWSVLKEDFMMGARMKDWDKGTKDEEQEENDAVEVYPSSDSESENSE